MARKLVVGITQGDGNGISYEVIIKALADELGYTITATKKADIIAEFLSQQ